jgi:predicted TIM-barrel fold metal-dependent hydrolase
VGQSFVDPQDDLKRLEEMLREHAFFAGAVVVLDAFKGFTAQEMRVMEQVMKYFGPERFIYGSDFPIFRMKARRTVENGVYINEIPQGQFPYESVKNDSHMREIPYPEAEKITFFIYEEMNACRLACQRMGLGKEDVEKIFFSNSARIFGVK